ncbi:MAG: PA2169 family four-helix-bundle protein [Verrucomicrobiota bacterium]
MTAAEEKTSNDAAELQRVLTRYIDSYHGYLQAAEVTDSTDLADAFREIAQRRESIVHEMAQLIRRNGEKPDETSSPEAAIHRWWMRVRAGLTEEELRATLAECVRGEKELRRTIQNAIEGGCLDTANARLLAEISEELHAAIATFEGALGH